MNKQNLRTIAKAYTFHYFSVFFSLLFAFFFVFLSKNLPNLNTKKRPALALSGGSEWRLRSGGKRKLTHFSP